MLNSVEISLKELCSNNLKEKLTGEVDLKNLAKLIIRGGWPANLEYSPKDASEAVNAYIDLIISDDLNRLDGIKCYHYQDYQNKEIDSIIELENGNWCAFEIKLGANKIDEAAKKLLELKQEIEKEKGKVPDVLCVICGLSNAAYKRPDGVYVVPITALKP